MAKKLQYRPDQNFVSKIVEGLNKRVTGQSRAIKEIGYGLQRAFAGIGNPDRPLEVLFFAGPSGVGKTETAHALSEVLREYRMEILTKQKIDEISKSIEAIIQEKDKALKDISKILEFDKFRLEDRTISPSEFAESEKNLKRVKERMNKQYDTLIQKCKEDLKNISKNIGEELLGLITIDCSSLNQDHTSSSLTSSPPGYKGSEKPGLLDPSKINDNPFVVILFDEFEKAHESIHRTLLPVFDKGKLQFSSPISVGDPFKGTIKEISHLDFRNAIIIMTSNIGSQEMGKTAMGKGVIGYRPTSKNTEAVNKLSDRAYEICKVEFEKIFSVEFRNRVKLIVFRYLEPESMREILDLRLNDFQERINKQNKGFVIRYANGVKSFLLQKAHHFAEQAREINSVIERELATPLAASLNQNDIEPGDIVVVRAGEDELEFYISKKEK